MIAANDESFRIACMLCFTAFIMGIALRYLLSRFANKYQTETLKQIIYYGDIYFQINDIILRSPKL